MKEAGKMSEVQANKWMPEKQPTDLSSEHWEVRICSYIKGDLISEKFPLSAKSPKIIANHSFEYYPIRTIIWHLFGDSNQSEKNNTETKPALLRKPMNGMNKQAYIPKHGMAFEFGTGHFCWTEQYGKPR